MKKVRNMFVLALVLLTVVSMSSVAGTYAKYTSTNTVTDTATVAKWDIKVGEKSLWEDGITFDLFDTVIDTKTDAAETDVAEGKIAPGTKGSFAIKISNAGEVNATYDIEFTAENSGVPIKYSLDGENWESNITKLNLTEQELAMGATDITKTVYWKWDYEGGSDEADKADTDLGIAGAATVEVSAKITATQVD